MINDMNVFKSLSKCMQFLFVGATEDQAITSVFPEYIESSVYFDESLNQQSNYICFLCGVVFSYRDIHSDKTQTTRRQQIVSTFFLIKVHICVIVCVSLNADISLLYIV